MLSRPSEPIIIIGMHRSGSSLLTEMLEAAGLFAGEKKDSNHEALFFLNLDRWLMSQTGGSWDNPGPIRWLIQNQTIRAMTVDYLRRYLLQSPRVVSYLGWTKYRQYRSLFNLPFRWGWKCPLTTFTLPLWLDVFPNAKIVHIYRHGVDVASSLRKRTIAGLRQNAFQKLYYKLPFLHWIRPKTGGFVQGIRCTSLEGGLSLWEEYLATAREHLRQSPSRAIEVKYEDLLASPVKTLEELMTFCEMPTSVDRLSKAALLIKKERAYAYRSSAELNVFASGIADRLQQQNY